MIPMTMKNMSPIRNTEHKYSNIFLTGVMGVGKTTIGRHIAREMRAAFYDSDAEIMRRSGVDISWIFEQEGEAGFRQREEAVIAECVQKQGIVLATGGGCVLLEANREALVQYGIVVYLSVSLSVQCERLSAHRNARPLWMTHASPDQLDALNAMRIGLYESIADLHYNTDHMVPLVLARHILRDCKILRHQYAAP